MLRMDSLLRLPLLWRRAVALFVLLLAADAWGAAVPSPGLPLLTNVAQVLNLRLDRAVMAYPVRLRGIVTYSDPEWVLWFLQEGTSGIYMYHKSGESRLEPGQEIEVVGYTINSHERLAVRTTTVKVLGQSPLPPARACSDEQLTGGNYDGQWVEIEDLVRSVTVLDHHHQLRLGRLGRFSVFIPARPGEFSPSNWVEAVVRVQGVVTPKLNGKNQRIGFTLYSPGLDRVSIVTPGNSDPFARPSLSAAQLRQSAIPLSADRRVKVRGVVTLQRANGNFFVQDSSGGVYVKPSRKLSLASGEQVAVAGFPVPSSTPSAPSTFEDAEVRRMGPGPLPAPVVLNVVETVQRKHENEMIEVRGRLLERLALEDRLVLVLREGKVSFEAWLEGTNTAQLLPDLREGSVLAVTGVSSANLTEKKSAHLFQMLLLSPSSVALVSGPPWWTAPRVGMVLGAVALSLLAWLGLGVRREAALRERYRQLFENAAEIVYAHRLAGNFTSLNPAGERITGWSRAQLVGMKMNDLVAPEQREQLQKAIAAIVESGQIGSLEFEIVTPQGERKSLEATARAIQRGGEAVAIEGIARDVTERKRAEEELKSSREQLRLLAARLRSIREEERTRIAREVHDELGQSLTGLKMDISSIASRLPTGEKILLERARAMSELIDESIRKVRQIATDLRPGILDNLGLVAALEWHAEDFQTRTGIECDFTAKLEDEGLNPELCTALFRIFQETLTNVTRHAQATAVIVTLEEWEGGLLLEVRDNGRGINERQIHWRESLGLLGMRERALACGGEVTITGTRGLGTTVTTRMPLARISEMRA